MVLGTFGQSLPSADTLALAKLIPYLNPIDNYVFDGPAKICHAPTTPSTAGKPTLDQMKYYNYYAASMYCQYQLKDLSCKFCQFFKKDVNTFAVLMNNVTDCTALVTVSNSRKEIVVTYRGTANIWNVIQDLDFLDIDYADMQSDIKVHTGFYKATMSLYNDVVKHVGVQVKLHPTYKVVIVGQSLGGAMARMTEFFFLHLNQFPGTIYEVYTYGEPRVGNVHFADYINKQKITTARIVNRADIVPHVPPVGVLATDILYDYYVHPQTEYWINGDSGTRFCNDSVYEDPTGSDSLGPAYSVLDHGTYFNVDYGTCVLDQPLLIAAIPFDIFQPVGKVPPLPLKMSNFIDAVVDFAVNILGPIFGR